MRKYAVIVAGGTGSRMGGDTPKQFMPLREKPVIYYPIQAFLDAYEDMRVILVLPAQHLKTGKKIVDSNFGKREVLMVPGGETRFHSVKNGLPLVDEESIIFVHDGVRCLLSPGPDSSPVMKKQWKPAALFLLCQAKTA